MNCRWISLRELGRHAQTGAYCGLACAAIILSPNIFACQVVRAEEPATTAPSQQVCTLEPGPARTVVRILDAETIALDDGSEVRLAGIVAPHARDANAEAGSWPLENDAIAELKELVLGRSVQLGFGKLKADRYGRRVAHVFENSAGTQRWVQGTMLAAGLARAYALPNSGECLSEMLAHEREARLRQIGIWSSPIYRPIDSKLTRTLMNLRSTFAIVSGKVVAVSRTRSAIYLNFGSDWHNDFSVRVPIAAAQADAGWDTRLERLKGRPVEVRGWIERANGPLISITHQVEITVLDGAGRPEDNQSANNRDSAARANAPVESVNPDLDSPDGNEKRPEPPVPGALDL